MPFCISTHVAAYTHIPPIVYPTIELGCDSCYSLMKATWSHASLYRLFQCVASNNRTNTDASHLHSFLRCAPIGDRAVGEQLARHTDLAKVKDSLFFGWLRLLHRAKWRRHGNESEWNEQDREVLKVGCRSIDRQRTILTRQRYAWERHNQGKRKRKRQRSRVYIETEKEREWERNWERDRYRERLRERKRQILREHAPEIER